VHGQPGAWLVPRWFIVRAIRMRATCPRAGRMRATRMRSITRVTTRTTGCGSRDRDGRRQRRIDQHDLRERLINERGHRRPRHTRVRPCEPQQHGVDAQRHDQPAHASSIPRRPRRDAHAV